VVMMMVMLPDLVLDYGAVGLAIVASWCS